jgi:hypothetical protein
MDCRLSGTVVALSLLLTTTHCGSSTPSGVGNDAGATGSVIADNLVTCPNSPNECTVAPAAKCSSASKCVGGYCIYTPNAGDKCLPPDVAYCNAGTHPECDRTDGSYPPDASGCGTKQCVVTGTICDWARCVAPGGH